jgi:casein kinase I family protein HRR25
MVRALERLHAKSYVHRDIKPENFVMGIGKKEGMVNLIDFGLSRRFRDKISGLHTPYRVQKSFIGTVRYASINAHFGIEQSRRDDLESLGNVMLYFLKGSLPWQNIKEETKAKKYEEIMKKKLNIPLNILCKDLPEEFQQYMAYCREMKFNQRADYRYITKIFKQLASQQEIEYDFIYDWSLPDIISLEVNLFRIVRN